MQRNDALAAFLERARRRLLPEPPPGAQDPDILPPTGDHQFSPNLVEILPLHPNKAAAVLIPVVARPQQPTLLLTRRSSGLRNHSGQIAFPGGRIDAADRGPLAAALREAEEEIGLAPTKVAPIGYLDLYLSGSGYRIAPVIGLIEPGFSLRLNPDEVEETFECPLSFLMDPANHRAESREWRGAIRHFYAIPYGQHYIWGITAGILRNLYERVYA